METLLINITKVEVYKQKDDIRRKQHQNNRLLKQKLNTI